MVYLYKVKEVVQTQYEIVMSQLMWAITEEDIVYEPNEFIL